jgi:hypothetical protein
VLTPHHSSHDIPSAINSPDPPAGARSVIRTPQSSATQCSPASGLARVCRIANPLALISAHHLGSYPAFLVSATRQLKIGTRDFCAVRDNDRLRFASGVVLVEFSALDLFDPHVGPTADR